MNAVSKRGLVSIIELLPWQHTLICLIVTLQHRNGKAFFGRT